MSWTSKVARGDHGSQGRGRRRRGLSQGRDAGPEEGETDGDPEAHGLGLSLEGGQSSRYVSKDTDPARLRALGFGRVFVSFHQNPRKAQP